MTLHGADERVCMEQTRAPAQKQTPALAWSSCAPAWSRRARACMGQTGAPLAWSRWTGLLHGTDGRALRRTDWRACVEQTGGPAESRRAGLRSRTDGLALSRRALRCEQRSQQLSRGGFS